MADAADRGKSTRFKPGQSGNRAGRPRRAKAPPMASSPFEELRQRRITVEMDGVQRELPLEEALLQQTLEAAFKGRRMAMRTILKVIVERDAAQAPEHRRVLPFLFEHTSPKLVDGAILVLGIASRSPVVGKAESSAILQLEPWAVISGLSRRRKRGRVTARAIADLKAHTRLASELSWPSADDE